MRLSRVAMLRFMFGYSLVAFLIFDICALFLGFFDICLVCYLKFAHLCLLYDICSVLRCVLRSVAHDI